MYIISIVKCLTNILICYIKSKRLTLIFTMITLLRFSDNHSTKVKNFMLDMMCPLILEADTISTQMLDIIFSQIVEPKKVKKTIMLMPKNVKLFFLNSIDFCIL